MIGIGFALAKLLLAQGCSVSICDLSESRLADADNRLQEFVQKLPKKSKDLKCTAHLVDVTNREQVDAFAESVIETHGKVSLIFNNAGVVAANTVENSSWYGSSLKV